MKKLFLLLLALVIFPCMAYAADPAPLDQNGLNSLIQKNRGKVIMLNFFATWCPPCRSEIPEIVALRNSYPPDKLLILGLSVDEDKAPLPLFLKQLKVNYPVYMAGRDITTVYNVSSVPYNAFISPQGQLIISGSGMADISVLKQVVNDILKSN